MNPIAPEQTTQWTKRPVVEIEIPIDARGAQQYTATQISDYEAILAHEIDRRCGGDPSKRQEAQEWMSMSSGGANGKSALLNRIASGLWPFMVPPPVSMSYPWYSVVESDSPEELWLEASDAQGLLALGDNSKGWLRKAWEAMRSENAANGLPPPPDLPRFRTVPINQSMWTVVRKVSDTHLEVTWPGWDDLGFIWRLSVDDVSAAQAHQAIAAWHDPSLKKITRHDQLVLEQRWHVDKRMQEMRAAMDPVLAADLMAQAKIKDGERSKFYQHSIQQSLQAKGAMVQERLDAGKPALPDDAEIQAMVDEAVGRYLKPRAGDGAGTGWYSVAQDGSLILHTWRICRITPAVIPESIYLNPAVLKRAQA